MKRRHVAIAAGRFLLDALSGKLGVPMMVMAYATSSVFLLAYVSTQVYTNSLMETIAEKKRSRQALEERIGVLTAQYTTLTAKSRISRQCEETMGMVSANMNDVVRVAVEGDALPESPVEPRVRVNEVLGTEISDLTQVVGE
ncbi:MAG: hypothetical protein OEX18_05300 [Candidatus Krumholzibacteria bacterium]|nr:hypothetical protein [Candidatus Krumholzibacteria bacterium]MDH4336677.1 hypothetical protein [Candidatus Krumholzibacteria bacterium]MDH5269020.1 hypothetical protein [Candidatus Krumholzibacteria bacterium]